MFSSKQLYCSDPFRKMWNLFTYYHNEDIVKNMLFHTYQTQQEEKEANSLAYQNTLKFIYLLKQGVSYFQAALESELMVQPQLLYYGITSFMKSLILMHDPYYPKTSIVLQHGLSTRKKKKSNYLFKDDFVKIQRDGLLPHFSKTVLEEVLVTHSKFKVENLYGQLPELQDSFLYQFKYKTMLSLRIDQIDSSSWKFSFSPQELAQQKLCLATLYHLFRAGASQSFRNEATGPRKQITMLEQEQAIILKTTKAASQAKLAHAHPQIMADYRGKYYYYFKKSLPHLEEIIIYNLLMYILGMLSRYDAEQWGEILYSSHSPDLFLIKELLQLTLRKFPNLILNILYQEKLIFIS